MPRLEIEIAVAKVGKYATSESGDTVEVIERPQGGISLVMADGQRSGRAAKTISNIVVRKAISLLAEGVRDGAVARAAHDYLRTIRSGKVSATLNIVSVDLETETLVISRNSHCPTFVLRRGQFSALDSPSDPVGIHSWTKPVISELPLEAHTWVIAFTDGVLHAGRRYGEGLDVAALTRGLLMADCPSARELADAILRQALASDRGRPDDDMSVVVVVISPAAGSSDDVRRLGIRFPVRIKGGG